MVELLIFIGIFSLFMLSMISFLNTINSTRLKSQISLEVDYQGSEVLRVMTQAIRNAKTIDFPAISASSDTLTVVSAMPATTTFSLSSSTIFMTENSNPPVALTNNLVHASSLVFSNYSKPATPGNIKIGFALSDASSTRSVSQYSLSFYGSASIR